MLVSGQKSLGGELNRRHRKSFYMTCEVRKGALLKSHQRLRTDLLSHLIVGKLAESSSSQLVLVYRDGLFCCILVIAIVGVFRHYVVGRLKHIERIWERVQCMAEAVLSENR